MKEKIYLVEQIDGDHEHVVLGAYSTEKKAERIVTALGKKGSSSWVESYILDDGIDELEAGLTPWKIVVSEDGEMREPERISVNEILGEAGNTYRYVDYATAHLPYGKGRKLLFWQMVWARDEAQARKLSEALLERIRSGEIPS